MLRVLERWRCGDPQLTVGSHALAPSVVRPSAGSRPRAPTGSTYSQPGPIEGRDAVPASGEGRQRRRVYPATTTPGYLL